MYRAVALCLLVAVVPLAAQSPCQDRQYQLIQRKSVGEMTVQEYDYYTRAKEACERAKAEAEQKEKRHRRRFVTVPLIVVGCGLAIMSPLIVSLAF